MQYLLYVSFEHKGKEILTDYQITAETRASAKNAAIERMVKSGGKKRSIDEIHLMDETFKRREKELSAHEGRRL